jgi:ligand-binding SRPBCC domain-containing protein
MPVIRLVTRIRAPVAVVFDLSRSIDLHLASTADTGERAVAGRMSGLIAMGETVTWEAVHFCIRQRLTVTISAFDRPHHFRDTMVSGAFRRFDHDHHFAPDGEGTVMTDAFDFTSPYGILGRCADLVVTGHMRRLLVGRNRLITTMAESGDVGRFIAGS